MGQVGRVALGRDLDLAGADVDPVLARGDRAGEAAVHRVIAQQVGVGLDRAQVVDRHDLDVRAAMLDDRAKHEAADAAEAVDGDANGHGGGLLSEGGYDWEPSRTIGALIQPRARNKVCSDVTKDRSRRSGAAGD
ncbi:hypothetical protein D3C81_1802670 [compost metagenome]